jgi:hypothetical protein
MNIRQLLKAVPLVLFLGATAFAQDDKPKVPFIQHDYCPFECCQYGTWTTESPLIAYKEEANDSVIAFRIKPGQSFTAIRGNVHILEPGFVVLDKTFNGFTKGDKVYLLSYLGEGAYDLWYKGKLLDVNADLVKLDAFWQNVTLKAKPLYVWCVLIKRSDGQQGWLRLKNSSKSDWWEETIKGMDSCS